VAQPNRAGSSGIALADIMHRMQRLSKAAEAQAWGALGGTTAFILGRFVQQKGGVLIAPAELSAVGYVCAIAAYTILSRSLFATNRCLTVARILFASGRINQAEYDQSRKKCLKKSGLI
jgi:hypothetical protein